MDPQKSQPNNVNSLQGLLRFAIERTQGEDPTSNSTYEEMDSDRKKFLENAMQSLTVDTLKELEKAIHILESESSSIDQKVNCIDMIQELTCDIDLSNNFITIGGSKIVMHGLNSDEPRLRSASAGLVAEVAQNNPFAQKHFTEKLFIPKLISLVNNVEYPEVVRNSLHAVSCIIREYEPALAIFIEEKGLESLLNSLTLTENRIVTKTTFLISRICAEFPMVGDEFNKLNAIEELCRCVEPNQNAEYDSKLENVLAALNVLTEANDLGKQNLRNVLDFKKTLNSIIEINKDDKSECEEIVMYSKALLKLL